MSTTVHPDAATVRRGPVLTLLLVSAFVVVLNETAMGVAMPSIMSDLDITATDAQWLTTAFMLTMAVIIPVTGVLLQRLTLRRAFFAALGLFSAGSALAGFAPDFTALLIARVVQAAGTAIMLPLLFTTVMVIVTPERRGRTMGLVAVVTAVAPAIGPTVSGVLLSTLGWRGIFVVLLPVAVLASAAGAVWLRNVTPTVPGRFDLLSVGLSAVGFAGLIYGLVTIVEGVPLAFLALVAGAVALAALVIRQLALRDTDRLLLDVRLFALRRFSLATGAIVIVSTALFGSLILLPLFVQDVLGESASVAGLVLLPGGILSGVLAPVVGAAYDRVGPRALIVPGSLIVAVAMAALATLGTTSPLGVVVGMHVLLSGGTALMITPLMTTALGSVAPEQYSQASAIVNTLQQVSGAAGVALFVTLFTLGSSPVAGVGLAFATGAVIACLAIPLGALLRRNRS